MLSQTQKKLKGYWQRRRNLRYARNYAELKEYDCCHSGRALRFDCLPDVGYTNNYDSQKKLI